VATVRTIWGLKNFRISEFQSEKPASKRVLDSGVSHNSVALLRGHMSLKSLDTYVVTTQRQISIMLSGKKLQAETKASNGRKSARPVQRKHCSRVHPITWHIFWRKHWCDKSNLQTRRTGNFFLIGVSVVLNISFLIICKNLDQTLSNLVKMRALGCTFC